MNCLGGLFLIKEVKGDMREKMSDRNTKVVIIFIILYAVLMAATVFWILPILRSVFKLGDIRMYLLSLAAAIIYGQVIMWIMSYFFEK